MLPVACVGFLKQKDRLCSSIESTNRLESSVLLAVQTIAGGVALLRKQLEK